PPLRPGDHRGLRREADVRLSARDVAAATRERAAGESQTGVARDARTRAAGSAAAAARKTGQRVAACRSRRTESNLAVGHDQGVGGAGDGMGVSGVRDRLLHARNHRMESFATLPERRSHRRGRTIGAGALAKRKPRGGADVDHGQWNAIYFDALYGNAFAVGHHAPPNGVSSSGRQQLHRAFSSQLEGGRSLGARVPQHGGGANVDRKLDRRIQSRPPSPKSAKSNAPPGVPSLASYTTFRGPTYPNLRGSLHNYPPQSKQDKDDFQTLCMPSGGPLAMWRPTKPPGN